VLALQTANWTEVLQLRAATAPEQLACRFVHDNGAAEQTLSYASLHRRAGSIAVQVAGANAIGKPALILCPPGIEFILALFGAMGAGAIAVPASPPQRKRRAGDRLSGIVRDARPTVVLTIEPLRKRVEEFLQEVAHRAEILCVDTIPLEASVGAIRAISPDDLACIQYTSGSTSEPRGVELTHANLLHNRLAIAQCFGHTPDSRGVIWLPPYHDMGLIGGILQPLFVGFPVTLMSPQVFVGNPLRWLRAISIFKGTTSGGPNFAYDLASSAVERADRSELAGIDLSSWSIAFNGAEPIDPKTLDRFASACGPLGFRRESFHPCYGLAEATLLACGPARPAGARVISLDGAARIGCGSAPEGHEIMILDPNSGAPCAAGQVGEICVAGPSIARGYHNRPDETRITFGSRTSASGQPMLRTGDLGAIIDGELVVAGRQKELIIIRGVNHYPHDIERSVQQSHPALREHAGAAVAIPGRDGGESLAIVQELRREHRHDDSPPIFDAICEALAEGHGLRPERIMLLEPGAIPLTPSGKIRRRACAEMLQGGKFQPLAEWREPIAARSRNHEPAPEARDGSETVRTWLIDRLAAQLAICPDELDPAHPLARYGLDSVGAVGIACQISAELRIDVDAMVFWDYPTVNELAEHLTQRRMTKRNSMLPAGAVGS
jgi:acyl-CoA synthetase (AMP-forming)/AMP-acid ligase II/acyl carrier protein